MSVWASVCLCVCARTCVHDAWVSVMCIYQCSHMNALVNMQRSENRCWRSGSLLPLCVFWLESGLPGLHAKEFCTLGLSFTSCFLPVDFNEHSKQAPHWKLSCLKFPSPNKLVYYIQPHSSTQSVGKIQPDHLQDIHAEYCMNFLQSDFWWCSCSSLKCTSQASTLPLLSMLF